jgi:hypothetical protein
LSPLMQEVPRGTLNNKQKCVITIMKRKFKQWWSSITLILTNKTNNHLSSKLNSRNTKRPWKSKSWLGTDAKMSQSSPLYNWISNGNAYIKKHTIKNLHRFASSQNSPVNLRKTRNKLPKKI